MKDHEAPTMTTDTIHLAFCIDDAYALPMSVTLRSLLAHTKRPIRAHVIDLSVIHI